MPVKFVQRQAALGPNDNSRPNANAIFVDSDDDQLKFTTGVSGTTTVDVVTESQTQTLTNKTLTSPVINSAAAVAATGLEIDNVADVSTRLVAGGATLTLTVATHSGRIILLDTAAGTTLTLPAATGSGAVFTAIVSVVPTSNQHRINVVGNDACVGTAIFESDNATDGVVGFVTGADTDQINLNGTTTGGLSRGDRVELVDIATDLWAVTIQASSSGTEATPFATGQVA